MSKQDALDFYAKAQNDEGLRAKAEEAAQSGEHANMAEVLVAMGKECGFTFTAEEIKDAMVDGAEIPDDELDEVAGGFGKSRDCPYGPKSCCAFNRSCDTYARCAVFYLSPDAKTLW